MPRYHDGGWGGWDVYDPARRVTHRGPFHTQPLENSGDEPPAPLNPLKDFRDAYGRGPLPLEWLALRQAIEVMRNGNSKGEADKILVARFGRPPSGVGSLDPQHPHPYWWAARYAAWKVCGQTHPLNRKKTWTKKRCNTCGICRGLKHFYPLSRGGYCSNCKACERSRKNG